MKLRFSIPYRTEWGEQLVVELTYLLQDGNQRKDAIVMQTQDGEQWTAETTSVESRRSRIASFTYIYKVVDADNRELRREWDMAPRNYSFDDSKTFTFQDQWRDYPLPLHLYSNAYAVTAGFKRNEMIELPQLPLFRRTILFRISAPQLTKHQHVAIIGSHPVLGSWNPARYLSMQYAGMKEWMLTVNVYGLQLPLEYKYVIVDDETHELMAWEEGENRVVDADVAEGEVLVLHGGVIRYAEKAWRLAGVSVPVSALRSTHSYGIGDFGDLYRLADWASLVGMRLIQLLPVNDTTCEHRHNDSHPYNIMSAFALHPLYIDLEQLGDLKDKKQMTMFRKQQRELNGQPTCDYEAVERVKWAYLSAFFEEQGAAVLATKEYTDWCEANEDWLAPYAQHFCALTPNVTEPLVRFTQYQLHRQLQRAAEHAHEKGIALKGDLPIGMRKESVDVLQHPDFFQLNELAGTPPDNQSKKGQNWGIPTYQWPEEPQKETNRKQPYSLTDWFHKRLQHQEQYFDAIRIDHVLGYFRMWQIPAQQLFGTMGHFSPALPFTAGEIEYFGLPFRKDLLTRPFINDKVIDQLFGIHAQYVRDAFLLRKPYGLYELKEEVNTQQKVAQLFEGKGDENSMWIRDGLWRLVANVLFLEDERTPEMYHPRFHAFQEPVFEVLGNEERNAFMTLYNNYYYQRHSMFWGHTGYQRLSELTTHSRLLFCAEDLGMLPECVSPVLDALRILSLEVQRLPKQSGVEYTHLDGNPIKSVATISTHDMEPLRLWWQDHPEQAQRFYTTMLQKQGRAPEQLPAHLAEEIIARHLYSPSMLCVLSLQDWLSMDRELRNKNVRAERINVPGDPYNQWSYRMHLTIEDLIAASRYNEKLKTMITRSKR